MICVLKIELYMFLVIRRYGEVVDVNLVRDKGTGKSKGFAFIAYEDQRSTNLSVGSSLYPIILKYVKFIFVSFDETSQQLIWSLNV
jgi:hypothetical protein